MVGTLRLTTETSWLDLSCLDLDRLDHGLGMVTATHSADPKDPGVASARSPCSTRRVGPRGARRGSITGPD